MQDTIVYPICVEDYVSATMKRKKKIIEGDLKSDKKTLG